MTATGTDLTRGQARAIEQALIAASPTFGQPNGNQINGTSPNRDC